MLRRPLLEATEQDVALVVAGGTLRVVDPALLPALGALAERGWVETADGVPRWISDHSSRGASEWERDERPSVSNRIAR